MPRSQAALPGQGSRDDDRQVFHELPPLHEARAFREDDARRHARASRRLRRIREGPPEGARRPSFRRGRSDSPRRRGHAFRGRVRVARAGGDGPRLHEGPLRVARARDAHSREASGQVRQSLGEYAVQLRRRSYARGQGRGEDPCRGGRSRQLPDGPLERRERFAGRDAQALEGLVRREDTPLLRFHVRSRRRNRTLSRAAQAGAGDRTRLRRGDRRARHAALRARRSGREEENAERSRFSARTSFRTGRRGTPTSSSARPSATTTGASPSTAGFPSAGRSSGSFPSRAWCSTASRG